MTRKGMIIGIAVVAIVGFVLLDSGGSAKKKAVPSHPLRPVKTMSVPSVRPAPSTPSLASVGCQVQYLSDGSANYDSSCNQGEVLDVAIASPARTICKKGWVASHIPAAWRTWYTQSLRAYGETGPAYKPEFIVPLMNGGAPVQANLWAMPTFTQTSTIGGAKLKDRLDLSLHRAICAGVMTVKKAADADAGDWRTFAHPSRH